MANEVRVAELPDCDYCLTYRRKVPALYDGKTKSGPWAYMCKRHFGAYGVGLGTGKGQRLVVAS